MLHGGSIGGLRGECGNLIALASMTSPNCAQQRASIRGRICPLATPAMAGVCAKNSSRPTSRRSWCQQCSVARSPMSAAAKARGPVRPIVRRPPDDGRRTVTSEGIVQSFVWLARHGKRNRPERLRCHRSQRRINPGGGPFINHVVSQIG